MSLTKNLPSKIKNIYSDIKAIDEKRQSGLSITITGPKGAGKSTLIKKFGWQRFEIFEELDGYKTISRDLLITVIPVNEKLGKDAVGHLKKIKDNENLVVLSKVDEPGFVDEILSELEVIGVNLNNVIPVSAVNDSGVKELKKKISESLGVERVALAYQAPSFASLAVEAAAKATAKQNALIATVLFIPGADMPVLTANQIKMILEIGAAYGVVLDWERAKEILAVIAVGYGFREIARQLLDFMPGPGWLIKGAVAYSGTLAIAKAADLYFQKVVAED